MTRVIAITPWFDESPLFLTGLITSAAPYVDHWVFSDGSYGLWTNGRPQSRQDQAQAIVETCQAAGIGLTLHRPQHVWVGNEVAKRNHLFALAELEAEADRDWYLILDADCIIDRGMPDLRDQLAATDMDAADVMVIERGDPYVNELRAAYESKVALPADFNYPLRALFRAIPGLRCDTAHFHYRAPDGRKLWGYPGETLEPALDLTDFRVEHRTHYRTAQRHQDAQTYYRRRDEAGVETPQAKVAA